MSHAQILCWSWEAFSCYSESDGSCIRGFPNIPALVSEVGSRTSNEHITTLLIPEMNFTCNASIVGFALAGRNFSNGSNNFQIQIWRKNSSHNSTTYYQVGHSVSVIVPYSGASGGVCLAAKRIVRNSFWCILHENYRVLVQPGDILGLELLRTNDDEIWFTSGGPVNYKFDN